MEEREASIRLGASVDGLSHLAPEVSARTLLSTAQKKVLLGLLGALIVLLLLATNTTLIVLMAMVIFSYLASVAFRVYLFILSARRSSVEIVDDRIAAGVPADELPIYTVLIPAYREPHVIDELIDKIARFDYPTEKLDVKILVEADDTETLEVLAAREPAEQFEVVIVPVAEPRTKPKALNFGLTLARGQLVAVYDVEDDPDPLQLRRAAVAMSSLGPDVGCLQAKLTYHNQMQNIITKWFTIDYLMWFSFFLPGLGALKTLVPLGGTSNHFRTEVLRAMGAWDPYNVTEDADLGVRMYREGYVVKVLESLTYEEANSDFVNWVRQRSRWYKGYVQSLFVHLRSPIELYREIGPIKMGHMIMFVGGTPFLALANPIFWFLTFLWVLVGPGPLQSIFPAPVYYAGLICFALGNFSIYYISVASCRIAGRRELFLSSLLIPAYWVMMSIAAVKAFWQLIFTPTFWEKTVHGLHLQGNLQVSPAAAVAEGQSGPREAVGFRQDESGPSGSSSE